MIRTGIRALDSGATAIRRRTARLFPGFGAVLTAIRPFLTAEFA